MKNNNIKKLKKGITIIVVFHIGAKDVDLEIINFLPKSMGVEFQK